MGKLLDWQRQALIDAYMGGEKESALAAEFGVSPSYPGILAGRSGCEKRPWGRPRKLEKSNSTAVPC